MDGIFLSLMYSFMFSFVMYLLLNVASSTLACMFLGNNSGEKPLAHYLPEFRTLCVFCSAAFVVVKVTGCNVGF